MSEKRNVAFYILNVLRKHSSEDNRLTKNKIKELLKSDYGRDCDLKTIRTSLQALIEMGFDVRYETKSSRDCKTNWYIERLFNEKETEAIMLSLYSCPSIERTELNEIVQKLEPYLCGGNRWKSVSADCSDCQRTPSARVIDTVFEAIGSCKMVNFPLVTHRFKSKPTFERDMMGFVRDYLVKPIGIYCLNARLYLYGEIGDTGRYRFFPIDRIYEPKITDIAFIPTKITPQSPRSTLEKSEPRADARERAVIVFDNSVLSEVYDQLGECCTVISEYNGKTELEVTAAYSHLLHFVLGFGSLAEVTFPTKLRRSVSVELQKASNKYRFQTKLRGFAN